jgi:hypothetical protein
MESHGEAGKIHVSEEFARALWQDPHPTLSRGERVPEVNTTSSSFSPWEKTGMRVLERGEMAIKGKGIMKTYFLERIN